MLEPTGDNFRALRLQLYMTQGQIAHVIGRHYMTIVAWEGRSGSPLPLHGRKAFAKIVKVLEDRAPIRMDDYKQES